MRCFLKNTTGQAVVEYVLILSVIVLMLIGFLKPLHQGFLSLGHGLFGTQGYFSCLLKTGLLPGRTQGIENCKTRAEVYDKFKDDLSKMGVKPPTGGGGERGGSKAPPLSSQQPDAAPPSSSGGGHSSQNPGRRQNKIPISRSSQTSPSPSSSSRRSTSSSKGKTLMPLSQKDTNSSGEGKSATAGEGSQNKKKFGYKNAPSSGSGAGNTYKIRKVGGFASSGFIEEERSQSRLPIPVSFAAKTKNFQMDKKKQLMSINHKKDQKEIQDKPWSFGSFIRTLLIICIILVLVLIVGSQSFQVKKSMK